jgi:cyclomaltodextrinase / maltogenic alpha-amylase / neopullulanase
MKRIALPLMALLAFFAQQSLAKMPSQTVEFVPQWAKSAVWYQVFPERFRNGDPSNDPTVNDIKGADPSDPPKQWQVHPWGSDWYERQPYEKANGEPELWKHMLRRRYGGDLQGVIDKLDYIKGMGFTAIYLNPIFDSPSSHKYDGASYHHVDPNLGPDPAGDRALMATENPLAPSTWVWTKADLLALTLIKEAHSRGIRIIFDGVFNHLGVNSFAFQDLKKNQQRSPYRDWFTVKTYADSAKGTAFDYEGWFGVKSLPELREDASGIVDGPKQYIFAATQRWMNPKGMGVEYGIDGWRLDVAYCIGHPFWKQWRKHVRAINPQAYMTAEIVEAPEKVKPYLQGDEFDGEMNYNFAFTCAEFFINPDSMRISASQFDRKLRELRESYPQGVAYVVQNLFGSHDANRIGSHIVNRGICNYRNWGTYFGKSQAAQNPLYNVRKPNAEELQLQKLFVIMQMTYIGAPMVYYGDEVGMWGGNDPDCRKPMVWDDIAYANEVYNVDGTKRTPDKVEVNQALQAHYKKLIAIRNANPALQLGTFKTLIADDAKDVYVFEREYKGSRLIVALNNSGKEQKVAVGGISGKSLEDLLNGKRYTSTKGGLTLTIMPKWADIVRVR